MLQTEQLSQVFQQEKFEMSKSMKNWKKVLVEPTTLIKSAIETLDKSGLQIVLVVDENNRLLGTITDGDVRRGILKGVSLDADVTLIMNASPISMRTNETRENVLAAMKSKGLYHIPLLDEEGCVVGMDTFEDLIHPEIKKNRVVLMAGGLGSRLRPLTANCPKPMLKVGNKPLLETILENFIEYGFREFYISVNHLADMVKDHFGDGSKWGVDIKYLEEDRKLGTAGALSLISEEQTEPLIVMNGDLLTKVNFGQLLNFHESNKAMATMCVREYDFQVPYGVVKIDKHKIIGIDEKPVQRFFVNAGIYVLNPSLLNIIKKNEYLDMPSLFEILIKDKEETNVFPIREYWLDIGHLSDYDKANGEYDTIFN